MRRFIYMNEKIREPDPKSPVIVVQTGRRLKHTNHARLIHNGEVIGEVRFKRGGLKEAPQHRVRAYVEIRPTVKVRYA